MFSVSKNKNILHFLLQIKTKSQANLIKPTLLSKKSNPTGSLKMKSFHVVQIMTWKSLSLHMFIYIYIYIVVVNFFVIILFRY